VKVLTVSKKIDETQDIDIEDIENIDLGE